MTDEQRFRIIGDDPGPETFIPSVSPRGSAMLLDVARRMRGEWTPEERAEMERFRAAAEAKQRAEWAAHLARHTELVGFATHPTVSALVKAHGPHAYPEEQPLGYECHACPGDYVDGDPVHPSWPCPTWLLIEQEGV